ncbi:MAG: hypothetical protein Q4B14_06985 [Clostridia bacterium]|nr:hypothetical protein [Clostridia bacterium]
MIKKLGKYTLHLKDKPSILSFASVAGTKEASGPIARYFDKIIDESENDKSWEEAESTLQKTAFEIALSKISKSSSDIDLIFAGDLLNQCISSTFALKDFNIPFLGQYGACSTMAQALLLAAIMVQTNCAGICAAVTSSHFCSAERQFRFPLDYGSQKSPTSQWTVTGSGCIIVGKNKNLPRISDVLIGKIVDFDISDSNNMGAAMAPADVKLTPYLIKTKQ